MDTDNEVVPEYDVKPLTRRALLIFGLALVGVPVICAASVTYSMFARTGDALLGIAVAAAGGALVGAALVRLAPKLGRLVPDQGSPVAIGLIVLAGVASASSRSLPPVIVATVDGAVIGFFAAFAIVLVAHWRRNPAFRSRIRSGWAGERVGAPTEPQHD